MVDAREDIITCDCPDYENQVNAVGKDKACCKHCYGLLKHLGYLSLEEYFEDMQQLKEMYEQHLIEEYYQDDNRAYYI